ncbi:MAG: c-type cytochrome [Deltaproteobacteria bacterium]|nr:c-type cytochrome [Deltaproteobacteria bacterium]MCW5806032.1 c-type cytochrome [Deltaproteobacteria bacterium]
MVRVDATELIAKYECTRCHEVPKVAAAVRDKHCVACHRQILDGTFAAEPERLAKWRGRITSLTDVPSLAGADRLRRAWVRDFLLRPHDVRPELVAEMPRLALAPADAEKLAGHLVPEDRADPVDGDPAAGEQLFRNLGCARCHRFTGASVDDTAMHATGAKQPAPLDRAWQLAPDLRYARDRVQPAQLAAWIAAPRGLMPKLGVDDAQARDLAAFLARTPLAALPPRPPAKRLPVLDRAVTWDEVEAKVFRNVCWHCHAVPDFARGDGGPGNSGGFGFAPRGLDVSSYTGIAAGSLDDEGERRSIFAQLPDGTPRVVAHLLARHTEAAGGIVDGIRGMPLGLPPLPLEEIQLVETWIAQGRPR